MTPEEVSVLQACSSTTATLSILGSTYIIVTFIRGRKSESFNSSLVVGLCSIDIFASISFALGPSAVPIPALCQVQAFVIQMFALASVFWTACMAWNLHSWFCGKVPESKLRKRLPLYIGLSLFPPFCSAVGLAAADDFDDAVLWCWIDVDHQGLRFALFYAWVVLAWSYVSYVSIKVRSEAQHRSEEAGGSSAAQKAEKIIVRKLYQYMLVFVIIWLIALINRIVNAAGSVVFALTLLQQIFVPIQGFLNALVYGNLLEPLLSRCGGGDNKAGIGRRSSRNLNSFGTDADVTWHECRLYTTTWNMGECEPAQEVMAAWLPPGYDVYSIGLQECMHFDETLAAIQSHLGEGYVRYTAKIGDTKKSLGYHGYIAIVVFASKPIVDSGKFRLLEQASEHVKRGKNLGVTRAANKGGVGLPFKWYDTQVALVGCHLTSDSKKDGKNVSKVESRDKDVVEIIQHLSLDYDSSNFHFCNTSHHSFLMGDLNYRIDSDAPTALALVCEAAGGPPAQKQPKLQHMTSRQLGKMVEERGQVAKEGATKEELIEALKQSDQTSAGTAPQETAARWGRLMQENDQLTASRREGHVFTGWEEEAVQWPPTYKRKEDAEGEVTDAADLEQLSSCFVTRLESKEEGELGVERTPSFTDRILWHSLPDMTDACKCEEYGSCERVTGSDHKPVFASIRLTLPEYTGRQKALKMSLQLSRMALTPAGAAAAAGDVTGQVTTMQVLFPIPPEDSLAAIRKLQEFTENQVRKTSEEESQKPLSSFDWRAAGSDVGVAWQASSQLGSLMHMLILLCDKHNKPLGQCVVALKEFPLDQPCDFSCPLADGGSAVGELSGRVAVTIGSGGVKTDGGTTEVTSSFPPIEQSVTQV